MTFRNALKWGEMEFCLPESIMLDSDIVEVGEDLFVRSQDYFVTVNEILNGRSSRIGGRTRSRASTKFYNAFSKFKW